MYNSFFCYGYGLIYAAITKYVKQTKEVKWRSLMWTNKTQIGDRHFHTDFD